MKRASILFPNNVRERFEIFSVLIVVTFFFSCRIIEISRSFFAYNFNDAGETDANDDL